VAWTKLIGFADHPDTAKCEIDTVCYRVLHVAARITRSRQIRLRIDATWRWATTISQACLQLREAFKHNTAHPTRGTPRALERPPTERHRPTCHAQTRNDHGSQPANTGFIYSEQAVRKIEADRPMPIAPMPAEDSPPTIPVDSE
jgi:hypothetical protein